MTRRLALVLVLSCCAQPPPTSVEKPTPAERPPNVVFVVVDDLGWKDTGVYGSTFHETPRIDDLASRGMLFTDAYAASPVCSPNRASLLTGKVPWRVGILKAIRFAVSPDEVLRVSMPSHGPPWKKVLEPIGLNALPQEEHTLAEALRGAGYATAHIGKWHLGRSAIAGPERHGYEVEIGVGDRPSVSYFSPFTAPSHPLSHLPEGPAGEYLTDRLTEEAVRFIEAHRDQPFLLSLWHYAVHTPLGAKPEKVAKYQAKLEARDGRERGRPETGPTEFAQDNPVYAAMVESVDESVGRVMETLTALGLSRSTLVIVTSDNGGHALREAHAEAPTSNEPLRGGKANLYEGGVRVPLIVHWPREIRPGSRSAEPVSSIDFYPTVLAAAGIEIPPDAVVDGLSLLPLFRGQPSLDRDALFWFYPRFKFPSSIRHRRYKLIRFHHGNADGSHRHELYDLERDLGETTDLAEEEPEKARRLARLLTRYLHATHAPLPRMNPRWDPRAIPPS